MGKNEPCSTCVFAKTGIHAWRNCRDQLSLKKKSRKRRHEIDGKKLALLPRAPRHRIRGGTSPAWWLLAATAALRGRPASQSAIDKPARRPSDVPPSQMLPDPIPPAPAITRWDARTVRETPARRNRGGGRRASTSGRRPTASTPATTDPPFAFLGGGASSC
jgi:hypothetical protein